MNELKAEPLRTVGWYTLELHCRWTHGEGPSVMQTFTGIDLDDCRRMAMQAGWRFHDGTSDCPRCGKQQLAKSHDTGANA